MELFAAIWTLCKYIIMSIICMVAYLLYAFVWAPYQVRNKYAKYPNVYMSEKYTPFLGEHAVLKKAMKENKYASYYLMQGGLDHPNGDVRLTFSAKQPYFFLSTAEALEEFVKLVPNKIDRWDYARKGFGRVGLNSLDQIRSNKSWKTRRDSIMRTIGINFSSKYIPLMLEKIQKYSEKWEVGKQFDFLLEMRHATFEIITEILFGKNITEKIGMLEYKSLKGEKSQMNFMLFLTTLFQDTAKAKNCIQSIMFPVLIYKNLFKPNSIVYENICTFRAKIREYLEANRDENSVFWQVYDKDNSIDKEILISDMVLYYFAGHDTSSHGICSIIFNLVKHPEIYQKCFEDIQNGLEVSERGQVKDCIEVSKIDSLDYLTCCIKESLRYDNPAALSLGYQAVEACSIRGIPLPKNAKIFLNIHGNHYNPSQWRKPEEFNPDRFDPESQDFKKPNGEARSPYAFIPFSFGLRNCAGKALAMLELKCLVSYLLMKFDFELDKKQMENEYIRFGISSQFHMMATVTKKY